MKKVNAFSCEYCGKLYENSDSCKRHEHRCYANPRTKSCASCIFLKRANFDYAEGRITLNTCLRNQDNVRKLKTNCSGFHYKKAMCNQKEMLQIRAGYFPYPIVDLHFQLD